MLNKIKYKIVGNVSRILGLFAHISLTRIGEEFGVRRICGGFFGQVYRDMRAFAFFGFELDPAAVTLHKALD